MSAGQNSGATRSPSLSAGKRVGFYEILELVGTGGVGEVYRARDTRSDRLVALKVLPASDEVARARVRRDARVVGSLNHPNICALFDIGTTGTADYLAFEFLEGESLAGRLERGSLSLDATLRIGVAIADALDKAHRAGVIHRDLRPANVMLTSSGVKLLDFGIGKIHTSSGTGDMGTTVAPAAAEGMKLGTIPYIAPEQLEGAAADARSDIWAVGVLLHECLTGGKEFEGSSKPALVSSMLTAESHPIAAGCIADRPDVVRVVTTCLQTSPDNRFQSARDLCLQLEWLLESSDAPLVEPPPRRGRSALLVGAGVVGGALAAALVLSERSAPAPAERPAGIHRFDVRLPTAVVLDEDSYELAISPDATQVVFAAVNGERQMLYVRALDDLEARAIPGTEDGYAPFFSPDGGSIGFFASRGPRGELKKVALAGGPATALCIARSGYGGAWLPDGTIVFSSEVAFGGPTGLRRIAASGADPTTLTTPESMQVRHTFPEVLPDGKSVLFAATSGGLSRIMVFDLATGRQTSLLEHGYHPRFVAPAHLAYVLNGTLMAVPFNAARRSVQGSPRPFRERVRSRTFTGDASFVVSRTGGLAYIEGDTATGSPPTQLVWVDRLGRETPIAAPPRAYGFPRLSPDGGRIALNVDEPDGTRIWIWNLERQTLSPLPSTADRDLYPTWMPDGRRIVFQSTRAGDPAIFMQSFDGTEPAEQLHQSLHPLVVDGVSSDAEFLVYRQAPPDTRHDLWALALNDGRAAVGLLATKATEVNADVSPDGSWLAYESNDSGQAQIYVQPFQRGDSERQQVSPAGGSRPLWSKDGRELFYWVPTSSSRGRMMSVTVRATTQHVVVGAPRQLFEGAYATGTLLRLFDVTRDGRRFVMIKDASRSTTSTAMPLVVVLNWADELSRPVAP